MIIKNIPIKHYEVGDYVRTPDGVGKVIKETIIGDDAHSITWVQHKQGISSNTQNDPVEFNDLWALILITEEEYDEEELF
jgi:hypothetical protein